MKAILHKAATRGHASHGWLDSWHTFSFANYYDPARMHFGALRVLNDDAVAPGMGFGKHPHDNMEIVSIPMEGALEHQDSLGNKQMIRQGDVQIMSAGTGLTHAEKNASTVVPVKFLQIWVLPNQKNVTPRYDQRTFSDEDRKNKLLTVVSPLGESEGVHIHQDAWFSLGNLQKNVELTYALKKQGNGVYFFLLEGEIVVNEIVLNRRDGLGISEAETFFIKATTNAQLLLMDVPLN
jgi:redox-sensitive bicupin YhaK (pirin superfamily)